MFWGAWREEGWNSNIALRVTFSFKHFQMSWEKCIYLKYNFNLPARSSQPWVEAFPQERAGVLYTGAASPKPWHSWNTQQLLEWSQKFPVSNTYFFLRLFLSQSPRHNFNYVSQTFVFVNSFQEKTLEICAGPGVHQPGIRSKLHNNQ